MNQERYSNGKLKPTAVQRAAKNAAAKARYRGELRSITLAKQAKYRAENLEKRRATVRKSDAKRREKLRAYHAKHYSANRDRIRAYVKATAKQRAEKQAQRRERDVNYRILCNLRSRMAAAVRTNKTGKAAKTTALVGCEIPLLRAWLESQFKPGMSWENYGEWHIDHRIPCAEFDLRDEAQQRQCFHYSNLQPLWGAENCAKGKKTNFQSNQSIQ